MQFFRNFFGKEFRFPLSIDRGLFSCYAEDRKEGISMHEELRKEIIRYLRERGFVQSSTRQESVIRPLTELYAEDDLGSTADGHYYSKQAVFAFLRENGYELTQGNFDLAVQHCYLDVQLSPEGVPCQAVTRSWISDYLPELSDEDLRTCLELAWLRERTAPVTTYEYQVVTLRDTFFSGKIKTDEMQRVLEDYSARGWRLVNSMMNQITNVVSAEARDQIVLIFERKIERRH